ncbi:MAG: (5-formylfuran-3-yl)methyl phosphate synthase [Hyphomicrobiaceae bacterium]
MKRVSFIAGGVPRLLASVTDVAEASVAVSCGADIIDAKDPAAGAMGALAPVAISAIRAALPAHVVLSATTGDVPVEAAARIIDAISRVSTAGADFVKIAILPPGDPHELLDVLAGCDVAHGRRVAVLMADRLPDMELLPRMPAAGFCGVMLDTADKASGSLTDIMTPSELTAFVGRAHDAGLFAGLAGALRLGHIGSVAAAKPDVIGFRGALCRGADRRARIDRHAVLTVRRAIDETGSAAVPTEQDYAGAAG